jgi:hypothetical protein
MSEQDHDSATHKTHLLTALHLCICAGASLDSHQHVHMCSTCWCNQQGLLSITCAQHAIAQHNTPHHSIVLITALIW